MSIVRKLKVWHIKRKARKAYLQWREFGADLDCGSHLASVLRPTHKLLADFAAMQFNRYMDQLAALGEKVPAGRLGGDT